MTPQVSDGHDAGILHCTEQETIRTEDLHVVARFETVNDVGLTFGETIPFESISAATQDEQNPEGHWIPGVRERLTHLEKFDAMDMEVGAFRTIYLTFSLLS